LALDVDGNCVGKGDMRAQIEQTFQNLERCLKAAGATWADVVKTNTSVTDFDEFQKCANIVRNRASQRPGARRWCSRIRGKLASGRRRRLEPLRLRYLDYQAPVELTNLAGDNTLGGVYF
jgi:enamine deaminase RidA (YjgF/YER057c/UK114 family)